jgi:hypothetical protein
VRENENKFFPKKKMCNAQHNNAFFLVEDHAGKILHVLEHKLITPKMAFHVLSMLL